MHTHVYSFPYVHIYLYFAFQNFIFEDIFRNLENNVFTSVHIYLFMYLFIYLFLERGGGRETSMFERNINRLPITCAPIRDLTHNPGMGPDWESNLQPFALPDDAQPMEPHQSGQ